MFEEMGFQGSGCGISTVGYQERLFIASDVVLHGVQKVANKVVDNFSDDAAAWGSAGSIPAKCLKSFVGSHVGTLSVAWLCGV